MAQNKSIKALIVEMINKIDDEKYLSYIYTLIKTLLSESEKVNKKEV